MKIYNAYNLLWIDNEVYPHDKLCLTVSGTMITIWNYETGRNLVHDDYSNILNKDDNYYESMADLLEVIKDFFANATQLLEVRVADIEEKLNPDFLLVDVWSDDYGQYPSIFTEYDGMMQIVNESATPVALLKFNMTTGNWDIIAGNGSNPFVPISQTTIFVHPTTFERYKFNGTTMEVYNDVNSIVPKWLKYEALLTQTGTDAPVARVLNQDEVNYLGDGFYSYIEPGIYWYNNIKIDNKLAIARTQNTTTSASVSLGTIELTSFEEGSYADNVFVNSGFTIKQRLRGAPPKLVSAETDEIGNVYLYFNKPLVYAKDLYGNEGTLAFVNSAFTYNNGVMTGLASAEFMNGNKTVFLNTQGWDIPLPVVACDISFSGGIFEANDFGLLQPFENFPVTNNVPAPPQLIDAYTNEEGNITTLVFDKEINDINEQGDDSWFKFIINDVDLGFIPNYIINQFTVDGNLLNLNLDLVFQYAIDNLSSIKISYNPETSYGSIPITSIDGGVLNGFSDFMVTNNLPEPVSP